MAHEFDYGFGFEMEAPGFSVERLGVGGEEFGIGLFELGVFWLPGNYGFF